MKKHEENWIYLLIIVMFLMLTNSCSKKDNKTVQVPILSTNAVSNITSPTASSGGNITNDGGASVTARGVCWSTSTMPTISNNKTTDGIGVGSFTSSITGLTPGQTYYIRAYATNSIGTAYGNEIAITITSLLPTITTSTVSAITATTATSGGNISSDGGAAVTARGVCWNTSQTPTISNNKTTDGIGVGSFTSSITGLTPGATYYFRAYATNSIGTAYGNEITITITALSPTITTSTVSAITATTAISGGNISSDGGAVITARGVCWSTSQTPTIVNSKTTDGTGVGSFTSNITGLTTNTTYYVRAYATNNAGTAYGNQVSFSSSSSGGVGTVTDIDGNVYHTVKIGTQTWIKEDLKTTKYRNGDQIIYVTDVTVWDKQTTGAYSDFRFDATYSLFDGKLYNWFAVNDSRNIAPIGWHVPTDSEWTTLTDYLKNNGYGDYRGEVAKSIAASSGWKTSYNAYDVGWNQESNNSSGFTAISYDAWYAFWWSSTSYDAINAYYRNISYNGNNVWRLYTNKTMGNPVRCIKD